MNEIKKLLKPLYHWFVRLSKWKRRIGLKCTDFTIISNNCTGGYIYQYFGIPYKTPTEGLYFTTEDYLKLLERPEYYFKHEVKLVDSQRSTLAKMGGDICYPVGLIDDVEVYFMHYPDPEEALSKWYRRASRMNFKKLFFLLTETELTTEDHIKRFSNLIGGKLLNDSVIMGICMMRKDRNLDHTLYVPDIPKDETNGNAAWRPEIIINSVNWKKIFNEL
ncbi:MULTISPECIES: DUF1919 domain-containing protein [Bacteroides]|uniref:DUF1919 domain-containing protein n=1 Tax=Bacteroides TaxID=816 RepID=UPI00033CF9EB|nr:MULTISPECIES: DUF1919 domain-containing protein [Bacteroides]UYU46502.1 DUF1919 domain-containing protein [Bacteroides salyersiae]CCY49851.1 putative uncharacterized protein [Bacteroides sp. CAG:189]